MNRTTMKQQAIAVTLLVFALVWLSGCGGGGVGPGRPMPQNTGTVRGQVVYMDYPDNPPTGVEVHVGNVVTYTENGWFEAQVPPGTYTVTVVPPEGFTLPPATAPTVTVVAGQTVTLEQPFVLIHDTDQPPTPP